MEYLLNWFVGNRMKGPKTILSLNIIISNNYKEENLIKTPLKKPELTGNNAEGINSLQKEVGKVNKRTQNFKTEKRQKKKNKT